MNAKELKDRIAQLKEAESKAMTAILENATEENVTKLNNLQKLRAESEAQLERVEGTSMVPDSEVGPKTSLSESQKYCDRFKEAVTTGTNFSGALPREMYSSVIKKIGQFANVAGLCDYHKLISDLALPVESGLPSVDYVIEGGNIGESAPTTSTVLLSAKKLACIGKISNEAIADVGFDLVAYVEDTIARAIANKLDHEILFGTGVTSGESASTNCITGVTTVSGIKSLTSKTTLVITWDEVKKALSSLGGYASGCTIVISQEVADMIHDFKDGSGNYIFPQNEELTRIKGHPVKISDQMPAIAKAKVMMLAGNFQYYALGMREEMDIMLLDQLYQATDMTGVKATVRADGKVTQAEAFSVIVSA